MGMGLRQNSTMRDRQAGVTGGFADGLRALLISTALGGLSEDERVDLKMLPPPVLSTQVDDGGSLLLVIEWGGSSQAHDWDGSESGALDIARSAGPLFAENLSADYWISGGWRNHRTRDGSFRTGPD